MLAPTLSSAASVAPAWPAPTAPRAAPRCARVTVRRMVPELRAPLAAPLAPARRSVLARVAGTPQGMSPELRKTIDTVVSSNKVVVFMKGTKQFPMCGFSNTVVQILNAMTVPFETVNILENDALRSGMKEYSQWPTFPQVYIGGEFFGGCDIMIESYQNGSLKEQLEIALNS